MIAVIDREALAKALKIVTAAVAKNTRGSMPVLNGVRIERTANVVTLTCTNIDLTIIAEVDAEPSRKKGDGVTVIPAEYLARIVGAMTGETVALETKAEKVSVTSADTTADLVTFDAETWPKHLTIEGPGVELDEDAIAVLSHAVVFCATDDSKATYMGVHFGPDGIRATDTYRALTYSLDGLPDVLVPKETIVAVLKGVETSVSIAASERTVAFTADRVTWISSTLPGTYPSFAPMDRETSPHSISFGRAELAEAIARVATLGADRVTFSLADGMATLSASTTDVGQITDQIKATGDMPFEVSFGNAIILPVIVAAGADDDFTMQMKDHRGSVVIQGGDLRMLLMPLVVTAAVVPT